MIDLEFRPPAPRNLVKAEDLSLHLFGHTLSVLVVQRDSPGVSFGFGNMVFSLRGLRPTDQENARGCD